MEFTHLTDEEIAYELALRHIHNVGAMTHRNKVLRLKALAQEEALRDIEYDRSGHVMDPSDDLENCSMGIKELQTLVNTAQKSKNSHDLSIVLSRLSHYKDRLARIEAPEHLTLSLHSLRQIVDTLYVNINSAIKNPVDQPVNRTLGAIPKVPQRSAVQQEHSPNQGASGFGDDHSAHDSRFGIAEEPGLPLSSSPLQSTQGRGRGIRSTQNNDRNSTGNNRGGSNSNNNLRPENDRDEYYQRLRDDLLDRILQMQLQPQRNDRTEDLLNRLLQAQLQSQRGERAEDRRMQKAIHNWPFKFRGEKDTKSVNTFLDRVEAFARSEGVNDEVLLSSIKHLLQEDALDWYARAISQGLLTSWNRFKQQIRKEYLPAQYGQLLRAEAFFRFQGQAESFAKYYRDITALFRFAEPAITEEEKFFMVKKNIHADYATVITAAKPRTLAELVEICLSYDDSRMLLNRQQRRMPIPPELLVEPNLATPSAAHKAPQHATSTQRFGRVHAIELDDLDHPAKTAVDPRKPATRVEPSEEECDEDDWMFRMDQMMEHVNAIKAQVERGYTRSPGASTNFRARSNTSDPQQQISWKNSQQLYNQNHPQANQPSRPRQQGAISTSQHQSDAQSSQLPYQQYRQNQGNSEVSSSIPAHQQHRQQHRPQEYVQQGSSSAEAGRPVLCRFRF